MKKNKLNSSHLTKSVKALLLFTCLLPKPVFSEQSNPASQKEVGETVEVEKIKEKYWAKGSEAEMGVIQSRLFSNAKKVEVGVNGGIISSDPFLSTKHLGGSAGYYFSDYFALHAIGWKSYASGSAALKTFEGDAGFTANTNQPKSFYGLQASGDFLYGKLSLLGQMIIYFDLHVRGGLGRTQTESGSYLTPFIGLGPQIHVSKRVSLSFDYRLMRYQENIVGKAPGANYGRVVGNRVNVTDVISLGLTFAFGD